MNHHMRADLHAHTHCSDGALSPAQLCRSARNRGLTHLAICDHDTVAAYDALDAEAIPSGLTVVPGIEVSTYLAGGEVHILGLGVDLAHPRLRRTVGNLIRRRSERMAGMFDKLVELGCFRRLGEEGRESLRAKLAERPRINEDLPPGSLGASACRMHLVAALLHSGDCQSAGEAFGRYIGNSGAAYIPYPRYPGDEAIEMIREAGGVPILAHPGLYKERWDKAIREAAGAGAAGVEVNHPKQKPAQRERIAALAAEVGLTLQSGGSDFHTFDSPLAKRFGRELTPVEHLTALFAEMTCPQYTPGTAPSRAR